MSGRKIRYNSSKKQKRIANNKSQYKNPWPSEIYKRNKGGIPIIVIIIIVCVILAAVGFLFSCQTPKDQPSGCTITYKADINKFDAPCKDSIFYTAFEIDTIIYH